MGKRIQAGVSEVPPACGLVVPSGLLFYDHLFSILDNYSLIVFPDSLTAEVIHRSIFAIAAIAVTNSYALNTVDFNFHNVFKVFPTIG